MHSDRWDMVGDPCPPQKTTGSITRGATYPATLTISGASFDLSTDVTEITGVVRDLENPNKVLARWTLTGGEFSVTSGAADGGVLQFSLSAALTKTYDWKKGFWDCTFTLTSGQVVPMFHGDVEVYQAAAR